MEAFIKAGEAHEKTNSLYHAGKAFENAAGASKDAKKNSEAAKLFKRACILYRRNGTPDAASAVLEKGGWSPE